VVAVAAAAAVAGAPLRGQSTVVNPSTPFAGLVSGSADGPGSTARFSGPKGLAIDGAGAVWVADTGNDTIRRIDPGGTVATAAGSAGLQGSADGRGGAAQFFHPSSVAADAGGDLYVADTPNQVIRKIAPDGTVTTLAGAAATPGSADGPGPAARFYNPGGVAVDASGNVYVADTYNDTIRRISASGQVTTLAGQAGSPGYQDGAGNAARFNSPNDLRVDAAGNVIVADTANHVIRRVAPDGTVSTVAGAAGVSGSADGPAASARFFDPEGVAVAGDGTIYVADTGNDTIRKVAPDGTVSTLAGIAGASGAANGPGAYAQFDAPQGIAVDASGTVYVADTGNSAIRKIGADGTVLTFAGPVSSTRLVNLSIRAQAGTGDSALIAGFVIGGSGSKALLLRGVGPTLAGYGVPSPLPDPKLSLFGANETLLDANTGWAGNATIAQVSSQLGAFALAAGSSDSALLETLGPALYTAQVTPASGIGSGVALAELYDDDAAASPARLMNLSARDQVGTGAGVLVAGFVLSGEAPETLLLRAVGPTLAQYGVASPLPAAQLTVFDAATNVIAANTGWGGSAALTAAFQASGAFLLPGGSADAALLVTLPPGLYTAQESGAGGATGVGLIEVYELSHP
jgi:sugar lactone lactonase YvrE